MTHDPFSGQHGPRRSAPPGGADRAITAGRRRLVRRRTATTAAGVSVAVVAGAALAGLDRGGRHSLDPTQPGPGRTDAAATATPSLPTIPTKGPVVPTIPPVTGSTSPTPDPGETGEPDPTLSAEPTRERGRFIGVTSGTVETRHHNDAAACSKVPDQATFVAQSGFCTILTGPASVTPGQVAEFSVSLCRPNTMPARTVKFESDYEVAIDVSIDDVGGERALWKWADREDFAPRLHTVTFNPGDCRTWTATWNGQDDEGYALAARSYQVNGYPFGYDWTHEDGDDAMGPAPQFYTIEVR